MTELSLAFLRDGYQALPRAWQRSDDPERDAMECRLLGRRALVVRGGHGARTFYDESVVERRGAIWLLNPGSPTERRRAPFHSMIVIRIGGKELFPELLRLT